jgi:hypothetical protein
VGNLAAHVVNLTVDEANIDQDVTFCRSAHILGSLACTELINIAERNPTLAAAAQIYVEAMTNMYHAACSSNDALANTCTICLGEYDTGEVLRRLPCLHSFHQPCIDAWMASNNTCPICRLDLLPHQPLPAEGAAESSLAGMPVASTV